MAEAVLIYPYIGDMDAIRDKPHLPLGLIQAASLIVDSHDVTLVDLRVEPRWKERLLKELAARPLYAGLSVMSGQPVARAWEVSCFIKENSQVPVLWGGIHPSLSPGETLADPAVDMVVIGDGEETLLEATRRLASGKSLEGVKGLWFKRDGKIIRNPLRDPVDMNTLPLPPYHLVDTERYVQEYAGKRVINLETSRGCNHGCRYCYHTGQGGDSRFRSLSAEKTVERMLWARDRFGVDGVYLVDDNFFLDFQRGLDVVHALKSESRPISWQIQGVGAPSMLRFGRRQLQDLEASGLQRISVGAESGSPKVLRYIRKPHTLEMVLEANRLWSGHAINIFYSWLCGVPGETMEDLRQTVRAMFQVIRDNPHARVSPIYNFLPFPGTPLWDEVVREQGFTGPARLSDWGMYDYGHVNVPYLDSRLKRTLNNLYFPSLCIDRKFDDYVLPWWLQWGVKLYRPIAVARMKTLFSRFPAEKAAAAILEKVLSAGTRRRSPWTL